MSTSVDVPSFEVVPEWEQLPEGVTHPDVADVAVGADDRIYVFNRGKQPMLVYERDGTFVRAWGEDEISNAHGVAVAPDGTILTVDNGSHTVRRFTPEGEPLLLIGTPGEPNDSGMGHWQFMSVPQSVGPFNMPTGVDALPSGEIVVSDGYGNARVHVFTPDGELIRSWGDPGEAEGQFRIPHGVVVADDGEHLLVCDRENHRVQVFDLHGTVVDIWTGLRRPNNLTVDPRGIVFVAELGDFSGRYGEGPPMPDEPYGSRVAVLDPAGHIVERIGTEAPCAPGSFYAAHGIAVDSHGDLYVAEVTWSAGAWEGKVPLDCHTFQKLARVPAP
jgi:DNA-binding beta-propeller fold protein YncE